MVSTVGGAFLWTEKHAILHKSVIFFSFFQKWSLLLSKQTHVTFLLSLESWNHHHLSPFPPYHNPIPISYHLRLSLRIRSCLYCFLFSFSWCFIVPLTSPLLYGSVNSFLCLSATVKTAGNWKQNNAGLGIFGSLFTLCWYERCLRRLHLPLVVLRPGPALGLASAGEASVGERTLALRPRQTAQTRWKGSSRRSGVRGMLGRNRE